MDFDNIKIDLIYEDIESPIEWLKIGMQLDYSGDYVMGKQFGTSQIERIFVENPYINGELHNSLTPNPIWAELTNKKRVLIGFIHEGIFTICDSFKSNKTYLQNL